MTILTLILIIGLLFWIVSYLNSDGYIIKNGRRTEGIIASVECRSQTDQYGRVHVRYIVLYQFEDSKERLYRGKFTIHSSRCRLKESEKIDVYYLPNKPHKNAVPSYSKSR